MSLKQLEYYENNDNNNAPNSVIYSHRSGLF